MYFDIISPSIVSMSVAYGKIAIGKAIRLLQSHKLFITGSAYVILHILQVVPTVNVKESNGIMTSKTDTSFATSHCSDMVIFIGNRL